MPWRFTHNGSFTQKQVTREDNASKKAGSKRKRKKACRVTSQDSKSTDLNLLVKHNASGSTIEKVITLKGESVCGRKFCGFCGFG